MVSGMTVKIYQGANGWYVTAEAADGFRFRIGTEYATREEAARALRVLRERDDAEYGVRWVE